MVKKENNEDYLYFSGGSYDMQAGVPVFAGEGEFMIGLRYLPSEQTVASDWRDMNNGDAIYMYSVSKLENQSMEYIEFFTYISGENRNGQYAAERSL